MTDTPDAIFSHPRLAAIYDAFDSPRVDLDAYVAMVQEFDARSVLDVGCGTGSLACRLSEVGIEVVGVDPAQASLDIARAKPFSEGVRWICGDATTLPALTVDIALMTGNVAQVFVTDEAWLRTLSAIRNIVRPDGHLVFEARDPSKKAWLNWTRDKTHQRRHVDTVGTVEGWCEVTSVSDDLVGFRHTYAFESDGSVLHSDTTLRFRQIEVIVSSLAQTGFRVDEVRDAPDRPGLEFVFVARPLG